MAEFTSVEDLLDFAMTREQEAYEFYMRLADRVDREAVRDMLRRFAQEEQAHKQKLAAIKAGGDLTELGGDVRDLKLAEYMVEVAPGSGLDYQETLMLAMQKEKAAFRLYTDMAAAAEDPELKRALELLAQEEARHKLRFELEYDDEILQED